MTASRTEIRDGRSFGFLGKQNKASLARSGSSSCREYDGVGMEPPIDQTPLKVQRKSGRFVPIVTDFCRRGPSPSSAAGRKAASEEQCAQKDIFFSSGVRGAASGTGKTVRKTETSSSKGVSESAKGQPKEAVTSPPATDSNRWESIWTAAKALRALPRTAQGNKTPSQRCRAENAGALDQPGKKEKRKGRLQNPGPSPECKTADNHTDPPSGRRAGSTPPSRPIRTAGSFPTGPRSAAKWRPRTSFIIGSPPPPARSS